MKYRLINKKVAGNGHLFLLSYLFVPAEHFVGRKMEFAFSFRRNGLCFLRLIKTLIKSTQYVPKERKSICIYIATTYKMFLSEQKRRKPL